MRSAFLRSTFDKFPTDGADHVVKKVPSHRRADPVRWNRAMADSNAASATRFAESLELGITVMEILPHLMHLSMHVRALGITCLVECDL